MNKIYMYILNTLLTDFFLPVNGCAKRNDDFHIITEGQSFELCAIFSCLREKHMMWYDMAIHYFFIYEVGPSRRLKETSFDEMLILQS